MGRKMQSKRMKSVKQQRITGHRCRMVGSREHPVGGGEESCEWVGFHLVMWVAIGTWWMTIESLPTPLLSQMLMATRILARCKVTGQMFWLCLDGEVPGRRSTSTGKKHVRATQ